MRELDFVIFDWLPGGDDSPAGQTPAALAILAGPDRAPLTEVEDLLTGAVRPHVYVPASALAEWLLANWWRLRWEPAPAAGQEPDAAWLLAHSLAAIGGGYAWPALEIAGRGDIVEIRSTAEAIPDLAAIRYLRGLALSVPAADFEAAVDAFVEQVEARLAARLPAERELSELRAELAEERANPELAQRCRRLAEAGNDPDAACHGGSRV